MTTTRKPNNRSAAPRNIFIANRKTSVRLERVMWDGLTDIANAEGKTLFELINEIHRDHAGANLSSAIRVFIVEHYRGSSDPSHFRKEKPRRSGVRFPMEIPCLSQGLGVLPGGAYHPETADGLLLKNEQKSIFHPDNPHNGAWVIGGAAKT